MKGHCKALLFLAIAAHCLILGCVAKRGDESTYTSQERVALDKFRKLVTPILYQDYMHDVMSRQLNPARANEMLQNHINWRKNENIDDLLNEAFPEFERDYRIDFQTRDKEGRPVVLFPYSSWDTRRATLAGQTKKLCRYMTKVLFEVPINMARKEGQSDGTNATQYIIIGDLLGYNLRQHACVRCLEIYLHFVQTYENQYPQTLFGFYGINIPRIFDPVLQLVRPLFSDQFEKSFKLLGPDQREWTANLRAFIEADQLPKRFGGTSSRVV